MSPELQKVGLSGNHIDSNMKRISLGNCLRLCAQIISIAGAICGLVLLYISAVGMLEWNLFSVSFSLFAFGFGALLIYTAYVMVFRYSVWSVKLFSFMVAFLFHGWISQVFRAYLDVYRERNMMLYDGVSVFAPVLLAVLLYFACKTILIKWTKIEGFRGRT